jgi:hypothetical protein
MSTPCATIIHRLWNCRNVLRDEQRSSVVGEVPYGDDIESAVDVGLVRAARLGQAVLQSASGEELRPFFGRMLMPSVLRPQGGAFKGEL